MKSLRLPWILLAFALLGALIGYYLSTQRPFSLAVDVAPEVVGQVTPAEAATEMVHGDWTGQAIAGAVSEDLDYPRGAIEGELLLQFATREAYLSYLQALAAAGMAPLGQIDALMVLRISEGALSVANIGESGARASYSYRVERPLPPVQVDPEALARLTAFGQSARVITGGPIAGSGAGVSVAILDSGIERHPQFDDVSIVRLDLVGGGVGGLGAGHGTSVASIIAGREGIAPDAELFVVRVLDAEGLGNSYHVAQGIVEAVDRGVQMINMSLGVYQDTVILRQAVNYAHARGVLMVAAAGNDGYGRMPYPAAYPEVLAVTAVDGNGQYALFPNQSMQIDFAAPGVGVLTALEDEGTVLFSGTSAAAPFVSGTLASLLSGEGALPPQQAVELLQAYLNDRGAPGVDPVYGAGLLDWDRLRERATPGILDVALADIYLQPDSLPGTTMPIEVTVQNRGTTWFSDAELEVFVGEAEPVSFILGSLGPGQTTTRKVFTQIPAQGSDEVLSLAARVIPQNINQDIRLENNLKSVAFRPVR
ncbi:S8 family serine peptidase [Coraliomargarita algicola]|uniref:S8 family serine peptidase n=1 Tax=Coraliomargarita algicola TaxID=3092156 RepID=A0ABZ0RHD7_9BACT|nr:S8 family serine peptidase [Coraliomargarita sp. J2-16]WPJ94435.1 S8 family serine peptidase [Coraliomargarita sp. J2-16]